MLERKACHLPSQAYWKQLVSHLPERDYVQKQFSLEPFSMLWPAYFSAFGSQIPVVLRTHSQSINSSTKDIIWGVFHTYFSPSEIQTSTKWHSLVCNQPRCNLHWKNYEHFKSFFCSFNQFHYSKKKILQDNPRKRNMLLCLVGECNVFFHMLRVLFGMFRLKIL